MNQSPKTPKTLPEVLAQRRATPSFDETPVADADLLQILEAGLNAPSGYNMQPWRFIVVREKARKQRLRDAAYNQAKVEEAPVVIVACGDQDGWRTGDLEEMLRQAREGGMPESFAAVVQERVPGMLSTLPNREAWLTRQVMIAFTHMMLMAESLGYDTAPMEGFEEDKIHDVLRLPLSYHVVALLAIGHRKGKDKFDGGRFPMRRTVSSEEFGRPLKLETEP
jgi:nitroreductase